MEKTLFSFLVCLPTLATAATETSLCINEIMQSNIDCLMVEHDFPDSWVELYNPTDNDISLKDYYIGTSNDVTSAFQITSSSTIKAKGYLLILCDKESRELHTDFRLESTSSGILYLFDASKIAVDSLSYPAMPAANIAYGRSSDEEGEWGWELNPTPGTDNDGGFSSLLLPEPVFSLKGQVMNSSNTLTISMPEGNYPADTKIYLTTDGKEPTRSSISGTEFTFDIKKNTVIRAKLLSDAALCRPSTSNSYIFHPRATTLPIVSILTDSSYLFSDNMGILSHSKTDGKPNFDYEWRRPVNAEYFDGTNGAAWFNQLGEVEVGGGASRSYNQKTLKLYANKRFGTKRLNGVLWEEKPDVKKVKSFMLRNGGNFSPNSRINDALVQRISGTGMSNIDYQAYSGVIVYINGEYKGIFGLRERANDNYVEANFGIEDIYYATHLSYLASGSTERTESTFDEVYSVYTCPKEKKKKMDNLIDVDNFMQAMIAEMYSTNRDFPDNNICIWRPIDKSMKWRWILKDLDFSFSASCGNEFNMFKFLLGSVSDKTLSSSDSEYKYANVSSIQNGARIYKKMISFNKFREAFIDVFAVYLGDFLKPSVTVPIYEKMKAEIDNEVPYTMSLYDYFSLDADLGYNYWIYYLRKSIETRPANVYQHMADFFNAHIEYDSLGTVIPMTLLPNGATVTINGIGLTKGNFEGAFFSKRSLRLNSGADAIGWRMQTFANDTATNSMVSVIDSTFLEREISVLLGKLTPCDSVSFTTFSFGESDFDKKLDELGITYDNLTDWSQEATIAFDEPRYAYANITCDSFPTSKEDNLHAYIDLYDNNGNFFRKKILLNLQGDSKIKSNLSVSFCEDNWVGDLTPAISFGDWVAQDEFHLKGFYADGLRGTAEIAYQFYSKVTDRDNCYPKAFPVSLYFNGNFYGIMAWQLKKHRANMGLDKKVAEHTWLDGTLNDKQLFQGAINWTKFEVRNPKDLYNMDGTEYDDDIPQEIMDETSSFYDPTKNKMVRCATVKK